MYLLLDLRWIDQKHFNKTALGMSGTYVKQKRKDSQRESGMSTLLSSQSWTHLYFLCPCWTWCKLQITCSLNVMVQKLNADVKPHWHAECFSTIALFQNDVEESETVQGDDDDNGHSNSLTKTRLQRCEHPEYASSNLPETFQTNHLLFYERFKAYQDYVLGKSKCSIILHQVLLNMPLTHALISC